MSAPIRTLPRPDDRPPTPPGGAALARPWRLLEPPTEADARTLARPLAEQFARTYQNRNIQAPVGTLSEDMSRFCEANVTGRYASWHYDRLAAELTTAEAA